MTKRVLIVDDERDIADSVKLVVNKLGYEAKTVNNGKSAIKLLKKEKFDLVLLDMLMPGISGRETLEIIRKDSKLKNQKVAFLTVVQLGQAGEEEIKKLRPIAYIQKPITDIIEFKNQLKKLLE
jgi:CheY-like chemotaxis protein